MSLSAAGESTSWPVFGEREAALAADAAPLYYDGLILAVILLVALSVILYRGLLRPRGRGRALQLLTAPPSAIAQASELLPPLSFFIVGLLQSALIVSLLTVLLLPPSRGVTALGAVPFWSGVGRLFLAVAGAFVLLTLVRAWMVYTLCPPGRRALWWADSQLARILAANLLLLFPLLLTLFASLSRGVALGLTGAIYLLYRGALCSRVLRLFPCLSRYPLHIILYLCVCEIGPFLFLLEGASLSVNQ